MSESIGHEWKMDDFSRIGFWTCRKCQGTSRTGIGDPEPSHDTKVIFERTKGTFSGDCEEMSMFKIKVEIENQLIRSKISKEMWIRIFEEIQVEQILKS